MSSATVLGEAGLCKASAIGISQTGAESRGIALPGRARGGIHARQVATSGGLNGHANTFLVCLPGSAALAGFA